MLEQQGTETCSPGWQDLLLIKLQQVDSKLMCRHRKMTHGTEDSLETDIDIYKKLIEGRVDITTELGKGEKLNSKWTEELDQ